MTRLIDLWDALVTLTCRAVAAHLGLNLYR